MFSDFHKPIKRPRRNQGRRLFSFIILILALFLTSIVIYGYFEAKHPATYIPHIKSGNLTKLGPTEEKVSFTNKWFILEVDVLGAISVSSTSGETILDGMTYYSDYMESGESYGFNNVSVRSENDSLILIQGSGANGVLATIQLKTSADNPRIDVTISTEYKYETTVQREALVLKYNLPVSGVYLKNRKVDLKPFEREYWLQKQGVSFGREHKSSLIYHTPDISSIQVNTNKKLAIVNLEFYLDHPLIYVPFQQDGGGRWVDNSAAFYTTGKQRMNHFSIYFGDIPDIIPRLMLVPSGYLAGYIFTEHPDGGNIRTHRATYFGSEKVVCSDSAIGGMVGHKIPVTKSVFFTDSAKVNSGNAIRNISGDTQLIDFLDQLFSTGMYDICLHTPENYNSNPETMAEASHFMKSRFNASTWIDHGMLPGNNNREAFICDGPNRNSEFYSADIWEKYGTRFFWNAAVEELQNSVPEPSINNELRKLRIDKAIVEVWRRYLFLNKYRSESFLAKWTELIKGYFPMFELNSLQPSKGNSYPTPLYWKNITCTNQFYSWPTEFVYVSMSPNACNDRLNQEKRQLDVLTSEWGVFFNHGYYVRNGDYDNFITVENGLLVINPCFDEILSYMAQIRNQGDLLITTVKDLLNYWILIENISFEYGSEGNVYIHNNNLEDIQGLSLVMRVDHQKIRIDGMRPTSRQVGEDAIIWFDLAAGSKVCLQINEIDPK